MENKKCEGCSKCSKDPDMENILSKYKQEKDNLIQILKGIGISFVSTIIFLVIFAIILTYTQVAENTINPVIILITALSILIGSSIANIKLKKNGLINGAIIGGIYMLIIYLISSILNWKFGLNLQSLIMIVVGVIFGILGGILGVNNMFGKK